MKTIVYPTRRITDPKFKYVPAHLTDVRITFRKFETVIKQLKQLQELLQQNKPTKA